MEEQLADSLRQLADVKNELDAVKKENDELKKTVAQMHLRLIRHSPPPADPSDIQKQKRKREEPREEPVVNLDSSLRSPSPKVRAPVAKSSDSWASFSWIPPVQARPVVAQSYTAPGINLPPGMQFFDTINIHRKF